MKYGAVQWKGVSRRLARKVTKRQARKQERQSALTQTKEAVYCPHNS